MVKKNSLKMMENIENVRKQRHDLRHQLMVIHELAHDGNKQKLFDYIETLIQDIPVGQTRFCENVVVNAIMAHFEAICQQQEIDFSVNIRIDSQSETVPDTDYCIIFSNLIENAVEACQYLPKEKRFIKVASQVRFNTLIITIDNSFDGQTTVSHGRYISRKRADYGVGLTSVQAVANKHGGDAQFKSNETVFLSSVYLTI